MNIWTGLFLLGIQICMIVVFAIFAKLPPKIPVEKVYESHSVPLSDYPMFQHIQVMILLGFGLLMTFLSKYSYSGVGLNFAVSAFTFQYAIICKKIFEPVNISLYSLVDGVVLTASVLITMGVLLGKTTLLQLLTISIVQTPIYLANKYLTEKLKVADVGGSVLVHTFGAYFGIAVSIIMGKPEGSNIETSSYNSDIFSIMGTLFLWIFWPSFNAVGSLTNEGKEKAVINTFLALTASCITTFGISSLTHQKHKFSMAHIQNGTLAGGVAIGTAADLIYFPWAALCIGSIAGGVSTLGFVYIQPWLLNHLHLHDTCGVHNLHGMPSIIAGIVGAIAAAGATTDLYGPQLYLMFPAMAPGNSSQELKELQTFLPIKPGEQRTAVRQASYQILSLLLTLTIAILGGITAGLLLKLSSRKSSPIVPGEYIYNDQFNWEMPSNTNDLHAPVPVVDTSSRQMGIT